MSAFVNIHTHQKQNPETIEVLSFSILDKVQTTEFFSLGLHPWHIDSKNYSEQMTKLTDSITKHRPKAIGECGIDRGIDTDIELQKELFKQQIDISESLEIPMVLHCVRAWFDCLEIRKKLKAKQPWIFHGYTGNLDTAKKIIAQNCRIFCKRF